MKKTISTSVRKQVYKRDNKTCVLCQHDEVIHLHHIVKRSQGGLSIPKNLVCLCPTCHKIVHGTYEWRNQFPFEQETANDALRYYILYTYEDEPFDENGNAKDEEEVTLPF
ncbi:MAG: HNH endonuclease [Oscillospiraceae bacterium]|jgi:5-methylcytosine-specific restriction endonuclease McrA|nr:HNH endonuclease [Oscillospiraceae bacterium]